jgi:hypothetical protein
MKASFYSFAAAAMLSLGVCSSAQGGAQSDGTPLLQSLERGLWQLRATGGGTAATSQLCLGDPRLIVQIQHGTTNCSHQLVNAGANSVTISYSCKGAGQGLTTIRKESGRLIQIKSQGIRNGSPFSFAAEGRRSGTC